MFATLMTIFLLFGFGVIMIGFLLKIIIDLWSIHYEKQHPELKDNYGWNFEQEDNMFR